MARGKSFHHKRKGHPGDFPEDQLKKPKNNTDEDEVYLGTAEAFKNRVPEQE